VTKYASREEQIARNAAGYPDLSQSIVRHDLQALRMRASAAFVRDGDWVLDVGCNAGYFRDFIPESAVLYGVDVNPDLVRRAARRMFAVCCPADDMPFSSRTFDVVNLAGVLEIVYDPVAAVNEAARVCRRVITGTVSHADGSWGRERVPVHDWHTRSYDEAEIRALLSSVGTIEVLGVVKSPGIMAPQCWYWCVAVPQTEIETGAAG